MPSVQDILLSSFPIAQALKVTWIMVLIAAASLILAVESIINLHRGFSRPDTIAPYRHYRFIAIATRDGLPSEAPGIDSFGMMLNEDGGFSRANTCCAAFLKGDLANFTTSGNTMTMSLPKAGSVWYTRWYIKMPGDASASKDAVRSRPYAPLMFVQTSL